MQRVNALRARLHEDDVTYGPRGGRRTLVLVVATLAAIAMVAVQYTRSKSARNEYSTDPLFQLF